MQSKCRIVYPVERLVRGVNTTPLELLIEFSFLSLELLVICNEGYIFFIFAMHAYNKSVPFKLLNNVYRS